MDEKDCRMLLLLESEQNITRAAEKLYITQPALVYRIRQIEADFGISLFERVGNRMILTEPANNLIQFAKEYIRLLEGTRESLTNLKQTRTEKLRIGVNTHFCHTVCPSLLKEFNVKHPNMRYYLCSGMSSELYSQLKSGDLDVAIVRGEFDWTKGKSFLDEERIGIVSKHNLNLDELPLLPRIAFKEPSYLAYFPNHPLVTIESLIQHWWAENYNLPTYNFLEVNEYSTCVQMADYDLGYAIVPEFFLKGYEHLNFKPLVYKDDSTATRKTWIYYDDAQFIKPSLAAFLAFLTEWYSTGKMINNT